MFLYFCNHKNTAKFFLFFGFSLQKWSEKKECPRITAKALQKIMTSD